MTRRLSGVIRLTTNEGLATALMATALGAFRQIHPAVRVDLLIDEKRLDIARGAADVALRTGEPPVEAGLVGRRLLSLPVAVYCSQEYAERNGRPTSIECLRNHMIIGVEGAIADLPAFRWLDAVTSSAEIVTRISSITSLISAAKAGMGVTVVPCFLADPDVALTRCLGPIEGAHSDLWLVTREDLRNVPRIRTFVDFLARHIKDRRHILAGGTTVQASFASADTADNLPELVASDTDVHLASENM